MHAYIDVSSVELFIDDGRVVLTEIFFPTEDFSRTDIFVSGGVTELQSAVVYSLEGIY
jgi:sucrose-6-phosphate hydrolase SacC (GH32 family)